MDLLGQEDAVKEKNTGKRIVLFLLILSILLLILIIYILTILPKEQVPKKDMLFIDNVSMETDQDFIITDQAGILYISLKDMANRIGDYTYNYGEYKKYIEDKNKCYLENLEEIIGFEGDSNIAYKTTRDSTIEYKYYDLTSNIINLNDKLYINVEDIQKVFNIQVDYQKTSNDIAKIQIFTIKYIESYYKTKLEEKGETTITIEPNAENKKAMINGIVVINSKGKVGVLDSELQTKISARYNNMIFDEYTKRFIVTIENNKMGVIDSNGKIMVEPEYDSIRIINYNPLLYEVKFNNKYGLISENGQKLTNIEYTKFGSEGNTAQNTKGVLVVPNINNKDSGIVASKNNKYTIINIATGKEITPYDLDKIYSKTSQSTDVTEYYGEVNNNVIKLRDYIEYVKDNLGNI